MAAVSNLAFKLGETWIIDATCKDSLGVVIDLSAAQSVKFRLTNPAGIVELDIAIGSGIVLLNGGTAGEILITITPAMQAAANIVSGYYLQQCRATLADGTVTDQFAGGFKVLPSLF
jgi:hypothetical protein